MRGGSDGRCHLGPLRGWEGESTANQLGGGEDILGPPPFWGSPPPKDPKPDPTTPPQTPKMTPRTDPPIQTPPIPPFLRTPNLFL